MLVTLLGQRVKEFLFSPSSSSLEFQSSLIRSHRINAHNTHIVVNHYTR